MKIARIVLGLLVVFLAQSSFGQSWSTYGAETLPRSMNAIAFDTGYPWAFRGGFIAPVTNSFEARPTLGLWYGVATHVPAVGLLASAQLKFRFFQRNRVHLAVAAEPGFAFHFHPSPFLFGLQIGFPQLLFTYNATQEIAIHAGIRMPIAIFFGREDVPTIALIPVLFRIAGEFNLSSAISLYFGMDMGVSIAATKDGSASDFAPIAVFGFAYRL